MMDIIMLSTVLIFLIFAYMCARLARYEKEAIEQVDEAKQQELLNNMRWWGDKE